jgi:BirA family biotin operon repressor/biotin-[acetyl-CoA-carboxylase] ligase
LGPREFHAEISSTQDRAVALARDGAAVGTRVVALRQTSGRGRLDHRWASPPGGVYLSIVLQAPGDHVTLLPLALGARLAQELSDAYSLSFRIKWPNDVVLVRDPDAPRKVAGILVDRVELPQGGRVEVAGIGINVTTPREALPPELRDSAISLSEAVSNPPTLEAVEAIVVRSALRAAIGLEGPGGADATRKICRRWLWGVGHRARVDGAEAGTIVGLGEEGELLLERGTERVAIRAGDVRVEGGA